MSFDTRWLRSLTQRWHSITFWIGIVGVFVILLDYLWEQHRNHLWAAIPFLLLILVSMGFLMCRKK